jgi:hypothetical protein
MQAECLCSGIVIIEKCDGSRETNTRNQALAGDIEERKYATSRDRTRPMPESVFPSWPSWQQRAPGSGGQILRDVADGQAGQVLRNFRDDELFDCGRK